MRRTNCSGLFSHFTLAGSSMRSHLGFVECCMVAIFTTVSSSVTASAGDRQADYIQLRLLIGEQHFSEALERCRVLIATYPDYVYLYETLAEIALYAQDLDGAAQFFEQRIEDGTRLELSYFGLGTVYYNMGAYREASLCFDRAIELGIEAPECYRNFVYAYERLEGVDASIRLFNSLCHRDPKNPHFWYAAALAYWSKRDYQTALKNLEEALSQNGQEQKYWQAKGAVLVLIGNLHEGAPLLAHLIKSAEKQADLGGVQFLTSYDVLGRDRQGAPKLHNDIAERSLQSAQRYGQFRWIGWWYERLANIEYSRSLYQSAILHSQIAFAASRKSLDNQLGLDALIRQVESSMDLGCYDTAMECAYEELKISQEEKDTGRTARSLNDLAWIYHELGVDDVAMEYAVGALSILENTNAGKELLMRVYATLGLIYEGMGNYESALANLRTSDQLIPKGIVWIPHRAVSHGNIGRVLMKIGNLDEARNHFSAELLLSRRALFTREEAYSLDNLAAYYERTGRRLTASRLYLRAYRLSEKIGQGPTLVASARGLAMLAAQQGHTHRAILWYKKALSFEESSTFVLKSNTSTSGKKMPLEKDVREYARLLICNGAGEAAFNMIEKWKLSLQSYQLPLARITETYGELPDSSKEEIVKICSQLRQIGFSFAVPRISGTKIEPHTDLQHLGTVTLALIRLQRALKQVAHKYPNVAERFQPSPATVYEVQRTFLSPKRAIIEYLVSEESSEVFVVRQDTFCIVHLPIKRSNVQKLVQRMSNVFSAEEKSSQVWSASLANFSSGACAEAYETLFKPLVPYLKSVDEVTIIPDDVLGGLAFECLVMDTPFSNSFGGVRFVTQRYAISYAFALTPLLPRCQVPHKPTKGVLAVGNPQIENPLMTPITGANRVSLLPSPSRAIPSLPGAEKEVRSIQSEFDGTITVLLHSEATKTAVMSLLSRYMVVHIAAHTRIDMDDPLSSCFYLVPDLGKGDPDKLLALDLLASNLAAQLVVLSSCNTVKFNEGKGGGGFVEALLGAGVPNVVGCLWNVDDDASALLMGRFYHYLNHGNPLSRALQRAKIDVICSGRSDPFYWAPFVLIGNGSTELPLLAPRGCDTHIFVASTAMIAALLFLGLIMKCGYLQNTLRSLTAGRRVQEKA
jgi:CHAT domain-containing protein/tetratricopeptide (TPR) repeat protein